MLDDKQIPDPNPIEVGCKVNFKPMNKVCYVVVINLNYNRPYFIKDAKGFSCWATSSEIERVIKSVAEEQTSFSFQVGDEVYYTHEDDECLNHPCKIIHVDSNDDGYPYHLESKRTGKTYWCGNGDIKLIK